VKIYDASGRTERPFGPSDSIPFRPAVRQVPIVPAAGDYRLCPGADRRDQLKVATEWRATMRKGLIKTIAGAALAAAGSGSVIAYPIFFRRRCLTWGATPEEVSGKLPGDELLPEAGLVSTRAVTINASPGAPPPVRVFNMLVMEPGSLIMERKMLLGIKQRAEDLAREAAPV